jgi:peroxiredoxin
MTKIKNCIFIAILLLIPVLPSFSQVINRVTINGKISNNTYPAATLSKFGAQVNEVNKSEISPAGEFTMTQEIVETDFYKLEFDKNTFIMMILKPGEVVEITTDAGEFMKNLKVRGSEETSHVFANQKIIDVAKTKRDSISNLSYQMMADPKHDSLMKVFSAEYDNIEMLKNKALTDFMRTHSTSLANLFLTEALPVDANLDAWQKLDTVLYTKYPNNIFVSNLHGQIAAAKKLRIGSVAPDFTLPDTSGVNVSLSSLRGKYVLIDFWAAWCGPCMKEMPNVIKLYNDFHPKGLEIIGASLDKSRDAWLGAIRNKKLPWIMVSDVKFWQSIVVPLYNVSAIPYTVLLDKEGRIIAKNLRGEDLYKKVESLLK